MATKTLYDRVKIVFLNYEGVDDEVIVQIRGNIDEVILLDINHAKGTEKRVFSEYGFETT